MRRNQYRQIGRGMTFGKLPRDIKKRLFLDVVYGKSDVESTEQVTMFLKDRPLILVYFFILD